VKKQTFLITAILLLGFCLRFWHISIVPPGIHADEADSGYNAYSLLKTGHDMYGTFLPYQITGFAENFRTPLSTYLTVPFVAVLGLNEMSIRLPAVLLGTFFPLLLYLLTKNLFSSKPLALLVAFAAAINPWAVHISRAYADHILAIDFVLLGLVFLTNKKKTVKYAMLGGAALGLSMFSYHAPKIFLPLFLPFFFYWVFKRRFFNQSTIISGGIFGIFFLAVVLLSLFFSGAQELSNVSIFNSDLSAKQVNKERRVTTAPLFVASVFHNKVLVHTKEFSRNFFTFLSPRYLFFDGEANLTAWIGDRGVFFPISLVFFLYGLFSLFKEKKDLGILLVGWILLGSIPGAITNNQMYTYRNIFVLPAMLLIISFGVLALMQNLNGSGVKKRVVLSCFAVLFAFNFLGYYFHYFFDYPVYSRSWWAADQRDTLLFAIEDGKLYDHVYVSGGRDWALLYAFYTKLDPIQFQKALRETEEKNGTEYITIGSFRFGPVFMKATDRPEDVLPSNTLYIGGANDFPKVPPLKRILAKDDWGTLYKIYATK